MINDVFNCVYLLLKNSNTDVKDYNIGYDIHIILAQSIERLFHDHGF